MLSVARDKRHPKRKSPIISINLRKIKGYFKDLFKKISVFSRQKLTVMFIPHSEKKAFNFRLSMVSLFFIAFIFVSLISFTIFAMTKFSGMSNIMEDQSASLAGYETDIDRYQDGISELNKIKRQYELDVEGILEVMGIKPEEIRNYDDSIGDLALVYGLEKKEDSFNKELNDLENMGETLDQSIARLNQVVKNISVYQEYLPLFPTLWPIDGGYGSISTEFGPNIHPIYGGLYLHIGIDISYLRGAAVVASANGKVIEVVSDEENPKNYGNYITIRHEFGYYTRYAHLDRVWVKEGDIVAQGQHIGDLGNTGLSSGAHLHYEVRFGSQVLDPRKFIYIQKNLGQ